MSARVFRSTGLLALTFLCYVYLSISSLRGVSVPMYTTLRRTTAAFTLAAEFVLTGHKNPPEIIASVLLMVIGALVAGARDLEFSLSGYALVICCNVATAVFLAMIARTAKDTNLNQFGLMWCNSIWCAPLLFCLILYRGDLVTSFGLEVAADVRFILLFLTSCLLAFLLNLTTFMNVAINSPLTQSVCGNLKDIAIIAVPLMSGTVQSDFYSLVGMGLGIGGSIMYATCKLLSSAAA